MGLETISREKASAYAGRGDIARVHGRHRDAEEAYRTALSLNPGEAYYLNALGYVYLAEGRKDEAGVLFLDAVELDTSRPDYRISLAGLYRQLGDSTECAAQINAVRMEMSRENEYLRACLAAVSGETADALRLLETALEKGLITREWAAQDADFVSLRGDPRFVALTCPPTVAAAS